MSTLIEPRALQLRSPLRRPERIAIIAKNPRLPPEDRQDFERAFHATGGNTGNLIFIEATANCIAGSKTYYDWDFDPAELSDSCDRAVLVGANMINPLLDLGDLAERLERLRVPLALFSIGVQAPLFVPDIHLQPGTERFLRTVAERVPVIGLRDSTAARVLDGMGIRNWRVIGCPSNFLNPRGDLDALLAGNIQADRPGRVTAVHLELVDSYPCYAQKCAELVAGAGCEHEYLVQAPLGLLQLAGLNRIDQIDESVLELLAPLGPRTPDEALEFARRCKAYFTPAEWMAAYGRYGFSFGARLHGNIFALQTGVPALIVAHDERVRSMAETLRAPHLLLPEFLQLSSLAEARDHAVSGLDAYLTRRRELAREFNTLLKDNGLDPVGLDAISGQVDLGNAGENTVTSDQKPAPAGLLPDAVERLRAQVNFHNMADPRNLSALGHLSRTEREQFALTTNSLVLYFGDEVAACKRAEERAALAAAPSGYDLELLNGLNIGCGNRLVSPYLTPVDIMRHSTGTASGGEHAALTPRALLAMPDELPFRPGSVDYIVALYTLERINDPVKAVLHWLDLLKPGGGVGIVLPHWRYTWDARTDAGRYGHKWNSSPELIQRLYREHWRDFCDLEQLDTLEYKISFDVVLRKRGTFKPFTRERLERSLSGQQLADCGMFLG